MASEAGRHTIILMQKGPTNSTRTYYDFGSVKKAVEGVVAMYENKLKDSFRGAGELTYDVKELLAWIDSMPDMACLVFQPSNGHYEPCDREWLKASVFEHLKRAAEGR